MRNISRRRFIEDSIFASAALAATSSQLWVPKAVFSQDKNVSANEKLGVLIVGCGGRGGSHMSEFLHDKRVKIVRNRRPTISKRTRVTVPRLSPICGRLSRILRSISSLARPATIGTPYAAFGRCRLASTPILKSRFAIISMKGKP